MEVWTPWTKWCVLQKHEAMASTTAYEHARRGSSKRFCDFHDKVFYPLCLYALTLNAELQEIFLACRKISSAAFWGIGIRKCPGEDQ
ncbi:putative uncharacterized protein YhiL [Trichinella spiralis]|uniref:Retrovirus-related Pol polyprotein from type-1 retrotransposable element n=1 Tax=Trichinella spiralis TaxID=6334 RepID=A0ABR3KQZ0_TRISP